MSPALPSSLPTEVWKEMEDAARRVEEMHARGRHVRFERKTHAGRLLIGLSDGADAPIRELLPSEALAILNDQDWE
jgi:hypothetical protein